VTRGRSVAVVGGGAFGLSAALELNTRGYDVVVIDPGPIPHPLASSTDISKAVRMDYGRDGFYSDLAHAALDGWRDWNRAWDRPLYHEVGILMISRKLMAPGSFEGDSYEAMLVRNVAVERLNAASLVSRYPAWRDSGYVGGYYNPSAGWVESGEAVRFLAKLARRSGVQLREGTACARVREQGSRVTGVVLEDGDELDADWVIVAAGAWTPRLLPYLAPMMWVVGQPVIHLRPTEPSRFAGQRFPVWCGDISTTGWYGFPVTSDGLLKIGNHGSGRDIAPGEALEPDDRERRQALRFVEQHLPTLAGTPIVGGRICLYCDTFDGNFLIDHDPDRPGLLVAAGGSGHGFKFVPVLGEIVADVLERRPNRWSDRFAWGRTGEGIGEQARSRE
jgi:glycine/D-amino acid oxidase-like deaminating enzyme